MLGFLKKNKDEKSNDGIVLKDAEDGGKKLVRYENKEGEILIPDELGITEIGDKVFKAPLFGESKITGITSNTVKKIGKQAFMDCINLENVSFPNVEIIEKDAFNNCSSLKSVSFPELITIGEFAFNTVMVNKNSSLESIYCPDVEKIGEFAFRNCSSLEKVSFPKIKRIEEETFTNCSSLKSVSCPDVETIGKLAFRDCSSLENVSFPMVKTIEPRAFKKCESLKSVSFPILETIEHGAFEDCLVLSTFLGNLNIKSIGDNAFTRVEISGGEISNELYFHYYPLSFEVEKYLGFKAVKKRNDVKYVKL